MHASPRENGPSGARDLLANRSSGFLPAGTHKSSVSRDHFESLVVKCNDRVLESCYVSSCNMPIVYLIPAIKVGNER